MPKTGWKYTKTMPNKGKVNMLKTSTASSKVGRSVPKGDKPHLRDNNTIRRLKMYETGKAVRNKEGLIVGGQFMMKTRAGDTEITATTGRIAPDRRWFGNTRVVDPKSLDEFREQMTQTTSDPYSVVLKRKKLPMGLLQDAVNMNENNQKAALLANESFAETFGSKSRRKRVKLEQLLVSRDEERKSKQTKKKLKRDMERGIAQPIGGKAESIKGVTLNEGDDKQINCDADGYGALLQAATESHKTYQDINDNEGIVPWGRDSNIQRRSGEGVDWIHEVKSDLFLKGQSRRIWGELWKVVDCSDVILHIVDARHVEGTRCRMLEHHILKNAPHKHLVFIVNKIDLVPNWVAKRWVGELAKSRPTIAFHASSTQAFGKGALISLLRQFSKLNDTKKQISVGIIGYPNVGKSSLINTLVGRKSCKVAPVPGETKIWQYVTLMKRIYLIDSPGVVVDTAGDTEADSVLKGVVRSERLETPEDFVGPILTKVKREHISAQYGIPKSGEGTWKSPEDLMEIIATKAGRLRKGGEPCLRSSAVTLINDFQRGKLPHYEAPPDLKEEDGGAESHKTNLDKNENVMQNLDDVGIKEKETSEEAGDNADADLENAAEASEKMEVVDEDAEEDEDEDEEGQEKMKDDAEADDSDEDADLPPVVVAGGGDWDDEEDDE
jgi:nuclear GTP-binding protein